MVLIILTLLTMVILHYQFHKVLFKLKTNLVHWVTVTGEDNIKGYTNIRIGYNASGYGQIGEVAISIS